MTESLELITETDVLFWICSARIMKMN